MFTETLKHPLGPPQTVCEVGLGWSPRPPGWPRLLTTTSWTERNENSRGWSRPEAKGLSTCFSPPPIQGRTRGGGWRRESNNSCLTQHLLRLIHILVYLELEKPPARKEKGIQIPRAKRALPGPPPAPGVQPESCNSVVSGTENTRSSWTSNLNALESS